MTIQVRQYNVDDNNVWDDLVDNSWNGTFLHTRRFLSYHGDRFTDASLVIEDEKNHVIGVFPAALDLISSNSVVSHPGITYGGIVHSGNLRGARMIEALEQICNFYRQIGFETLIYKAVPHIYHTVPASDDLYALFRISATRYRCDLSAAIDLQDRNKPSQRRIRSLNKAKKNNVCVTIIDGDFDEFWNILENNLREKHNVNPVHTLSEIHLLRSMFPNNIQLITGLIDGKITSGIVLFNTRRTLHAQYIASNQQGQDASALDAIFEYCLEVGKNSGKKYFNFGVSTEDEGKYLNNGLHQFKTEFGAGGMVHEFYRISLV